MNPHHIVAGSGTVLVLLTAISTCSFAFPQPAVVIQNPDPANQSGFGHSVVVDGHQALIGAYGFDGAVFLIDTQDSSVVQSYLKPTSDDWAGFGASAAINDEYVLVGGPFAGNIAWLFDRDSGQYLRPLVGDSVSLFGWSTQIDDNRLIVGAPDKTVAGNASGHVQVFDVDGSLQQTLSDGAGQAQSFGISLLAVDGRLFVGAPRTDIGGQIDAGRVYVYDYDPMSGYQLTDTITGPSGAANFGWSLAAEGNQLLVGSPGDNGNLGAAHLVDLSTGSLLRTFSNPNPHAADFYGEDVAFAGYNVLIGAPDDDLSGKDAGIAYLFDRDTGTLVETFDNPTPESNERFGWAVTTVGNRLLVSAEFDRTAGSNGTVYLYDGYLVPEPTQLGGLAAALVCSLIVVRRH